MALSIDKPRLDNLANEIWKSAERLRGKFKAYEYQNEDHTLLEENFRAYLNGFSKNVSFGDWRKKQKICWKGWRCKTVEDEN
jgi:hypothetical protein